MDKPNPFFSEYERKPAWLQKKLHVPSNSGWEEIDSFITRVRNGRSTALFIAPYARGSGTTHFIHKELKPALEASGCVCAVARRQVRPLNNALRRVIDLPQVVTELAAPNERLTASEENMEWLPETVAATRKRSVWRKKCGIGCEAREPYAPKVFSHSIGKRMDGQEPVDDEDELDPFAYDRYMRRRRDEGNFTSITALGELASQNNRVLCVIARLENNALIGSNSKSDAKFAADMVMRQIDPYLEVKNVLVIVVMCKPAPMLMRRLKDKGFPVARFSKRSHDWVKGVLKAHQEESGFEWFTDDALELIAKRVNGRIAHAMGWCGAMVDEASAKGGKFPLDAAHVKKNMGAGIYEGNYETVGFRF